MYAMLNKINQIKHILFHIKRPGTIGAYIVWKHSWFSWSTQQDRMHHYTSLCRPGPTPPPKLANLSVPLRTFFFGSVSLTQAKERFVPSEPYKYLREKIFSYVRSKSNDLKTPKYIYAFRAFSS